MRFLAALLLCVCANAEILDVHTRFEKGQRLTLEIKRWRDDSRGKVDSPASVPATVSVLESGDEGFVIDWVPGETRYEKPEQLQNPFLRTIALAVKDAHFEIQLNRLGQVTGLRNRADIQAKASKWISAAIPQVAPLLRDAAGRKQFAASAETAVTSGTLITAVLSDVGRYLALTGSSVDSAKPLKSKVIAMNPLQIGKIACELEISAHAIDYEKKEIVVETKQKYDPNGFAGLTTQILRQSGVAIRLTDTIPELNLTDQAEYLVDLNHGWPRHAKHMRIITIGDMLRRVDHTEIQTIKVELPQAP